MIANSASPLSGVDHGANHYERLDRAVGQLAHGDERHLARVVDLR